jgi:alpha-glucosidase (family GH31 glycosyl hydrolase)
MITPVLEANTFKLKVYFPNDTWYDYYTGELITQTLINEFKLVEAPLDKINVYLRSGYIIPLQHCQTTTNESRKNPFYLIVALNNHNNSSGYLYWDDGETINTIETRHYNYVTFVANYSPLTFSGSLTINLEVNGYETNMIFDEFIIYGVLKMPNKVIINNNNYDNFIYDNKLKVSF